VSLVTRRGHYPFLLADAVQGGGYLPLREWDDAHVLLA